MLVIKVGSSEDLTTVSVMTSTSNADEIHFMINMDNGKTLGFCGDEHVPYADVTSGGEALTMLVRLNGGLL